MSMKHYSNTDNPVDFPVPARKNGRCTTIMYMFPPHPKNKFKYCFEMLNYGGEQRAELEAWCMQDPIDRRWGNMGYVECQKDEDAIEFINKWGINWKKYFPKDKQIKSELGYSRVGLGNV
jgi:hypothetical protein